jgi:hypothetical protein
MYKQMLEFGCLVFTTPVYNLIYIQLTAEKWNPKSGTIKKLDIFVSGYQKFPDFGCPVIVVVCGYRIAFENRSGFQIVRFLNVCFWGQKKVSILRINCTVYIQKPDRPSFEWSSLGHFLCQGFKWLDHLKPGHKSPGFEWSKPRPFYYKENISYDPLLI